MRSLTALKHRQRQRATVVYGIQPVSQAVASGWPVQVLVYAPGLLLNAGARTMVEQQRSEGVDVVTFDNELFRRLSGRNWSGGLAAIVSTRYVETCDITLGPDATVLALDRIANPGNLGAIVRTADATGAAGVILLGSAADAFDPAAVRASMGAVFNVPIARMNGTAEFFGWAASSGLPVVTTATWAEGRLWATPLPRRLAVLMGSEGPGLTCGDVVDGSIQLAIPMGGTADSLNLAVATGVVLYEVWRQRATSLREEDWAQHTLPNQRSGIDRETSVDHGQTHAK